MKKSAFETKVGPRIPDLRTLLLDLALRYRMKRTMKRGVTDDTLRKSAARFAASMKNAKTPKHVTVTPLTIGGRHAEWVTTVGDTAKVILYFHGGGFMMSSPKDHRPIIWRLSRATGRRVLAIDYRKAPDHAFPAWVDDAFATYEYALAEGFAPSDIILSGDSAGGNIALALAHRIRAAKLPMPEALVLFSPWADLACAGRTYRTKRLRDAMFDGEAVREMGRYLTRHCDPRDPEVSPIHADFTGFPRMVILAGSTEVFLDDARAVVRRAAAAGVDAQLFVYRHMPHVFPMFAGQVPRAKEGFAIVQRFLEGKRVDKRSNGAAVTPTPRHVGSPVRA